MAVIQQVTVNSYQGTGSLKVFPYTFHVFSANDIAVYIDGVKQTSGYTVSNVGVTNGGDVTFTTAPANNAVVTIARVTSIDRNTDYVNGGKLDAETLDADIDRVVMMVQDVQSSTLQIDPVGDIDAGGRHITNVGDPEDDQDAVTKLWAESAFMTGGGGGTFTVEEYTASASQTIFPVAITLPAPNLKLTRVYVNGLHKLPSTYTEDTATNSIIFSSGLNTNDKVCFVMTSPVKVGAIAATNVQLGDVAGNFLSDNAEGALAELADKFDTHELAVDPHPQYQTQAESDAAYEPINANIQSHIASTANPHAVTKSQVGLGNADNTSDANKPISTATQTALNLKLDSASYTAADVLTKVKTVDGAGSGLDADLLDGLDSTSFATSTHNHSGVYEPANANIQSHISSTANPHSVTKAQVGLGNVDNTSDANKPISTATQTALNAKLDAATYTAADVLAKLVTVDGAGSGLDADLLDGLSSAAFATAAHNHSGVYEPANANIQSHISSTSNPHAVTKSQVGLGNADNTSDANKPISTATQTALDGKSPKSGFPVDSNGNYLVTLSYNETTRTATITPTGGTFDVFVNGTKYTKTGAQSVVHSATQGNQFIYYDNTGTLVTSTTPWNLAQTAPVMFVFWDATNSRGIPFYEWHHAGRDVFLHERLHSVDGTQIVSGFTASGYTLNDGATDAAIKFAVSTGVIADEDIQTTTQALTTSGPYVILERAGASGDWRFSRTNTFPYLFSGNNLQYNQYTGATWQRTNVGEDQYVNYWVFAVPALATGSITPAPTSTQQIVLVPGQVTYASEALATAATPAALSWGSLPFQEIAPLYKITLRYNASNPSAFSNTLRSSIVSFVRVVGDKATITQAAQADHGALTGLSDPDHPATAIYTNTASFNGALSAADTTVQAALDTLDDAVAAKLPSASYTAADVLAKLVTVDGSGSGLDADLLDGLSSAAFATAAHNHSGTYEPANANIQSHISSTSNPHAVTKSQVGLGSVDNTSDLAKPISTATQTALDLKANLASPALTGVPTAPTAAPSTNTTQIATTAFVIAEVDSVLAGAVTDTSVLTALDTVTASTNLVQQTDQNTYMRESAGATLIPGRVYAIYNFGTSKTMYLPLASATVLGDTIEFLELYNTWRSPPAGISFTIDHSDSTTYVDYVLGQTIVIGNDTPANVKGFKLTCTHISGSNAYWTVTQ